MAMTVTITQPPKHDDDDDKHKNCKEQQKALPAAAIASASE